uniref:Uncharacterized protein n=1 Tax=Manihot esculenta TaxID=3983 RepID=A0A2C9VMM5_MANES
MMKVKNINIYVLKRIRIRDIRLYIISSFLTYTMKF